MCSRRNFLSVEFIYFRTRFSYETECRQRFRVHEMECLNCPSTLGIQHLSSLNKVGIIIWSDWPGYDGNNYPVEDDHDDPVRCISRAINAAIETLPNRPAFRFERAQDKCIHFEPVSSLTEQQGLMVPSTSLLLLPHTLSSI